MATKKHSQVTIASRHPLPQLSYADAANRIAGTNEQSGITLSATNVHSMAHQRDNDTFWMLVDFSPITWGQILSASPDLVLAGDLDVGGDMKVDGSGYFKGTLPAFEASSFSFDLFSGEARIMAIGPDGATAGKLCLVTTASDGTPFYTAFCIDKNGNAVIGYPDTEFAAQTNPRLWFQSGTTSSTTEHGYIGHDKTDLVINQGAGTTRLAGGVSHKVTTVNAATYDLLISDYILHVTYTATGAVTSLTLPTAQTLLGRTIIIKDAGLNAGTFNITIDTEGGELIDGAATYVMSSNAESVTLYSDGTDWFSI